MDNEELEDRREITRSMACQMLTNGSRQGMMAGLEMVGCGHVARCGDVIRVVAPPPPVRVATFAAAPMAGEDFSLCAALVAIRMR